MIPVKQKLKLRPSSRIATAENAFIPKKIPVLIYNQREDILDYLGYRHITGVKTWGALAKAKYINQLFEIYSQEIPNPEFVFQKIAKVVATKPAYAKKTLTTLELYEFANEQAYWDLANISSETIDFSVLGTALNYNNIVQFLGLKNAQDWNLKNLKVKETRELFSWLFVKSSEQKTRIGESRNLRDLAKVVGNEQALLAFRDGASLSDAALYTDAADENFRKFIQDSLKWLREADKQSKRMISPSQSDSEIVSDVQETSRGLYLYLKDRLSELTSD